MTTHKPECSPNSGENPCPLKGRMGQCGQEKCIHSHWSADSAKEGWEERFDNLWEQESGMAMPEITKPFKDFIRSLLTTAREEGRQEGLKEALSKVQTEHRRYPDNQDYGLAKLALKNVEDALTNLIK